MNKLGAMLFRLSPKQLMALTICVIIAFWYALNSFVVGPVRAELDAASKTAADLENQINTERRIAANLDRYREEVESYKAVQDLAQRQLPQKREIASLLTSVQSIAKDIGLDVRSFVIGEDKLQQEFAEIPVTVAMRGSFHQVVSFFDEVSRLSRIVSIGGLKLSDPRGYAEEGSVGLNVAFVLTAYRQLEEFEKHKPETDTAKGKKKKGSTANNSSAATSTKVLKK